MRWVLLAWFIVAAVVVAFGGDLLWADKPGHQPGDVRVIEQPHPETRPERTYRVHEEMRKLLRSCHSCHYTVQVWTPKVL